MKSLIYDVITGAAIIMALFVVTKVMRANQKFIVTQSGAKTDNEQVYLDSESEAKENTYTAADVYGTFHTILENGNNSDDSSRWKVYDYTKFILKVPGVSYTVAYNDYSQARLQAIENQLLTYLETSPNTQFIRKKDSSYDNAAKHKVTIYEFQQKTGGALLPTEETPIIPVPDEIVVPVTPEDPGFIPTPGTPESPTEFDASQMYLQFKNILEPADGATLYDSNNKVASGTKVRENIKYKLVVNLLSKSVNSTSSNTNLNYIDGFFRYYLMNMPGAKFEKEEKTIGDEKNITVTLKEGSMPSLGSGEVITSAVAKTYFNQALAQGGNYSYRLQIGNSKVYFIGNGDTTESIDIQNSIEFFDKANATFNCQKVNIGGPSDAGIQYLVTLKTIG